MSITIKPRVKILARWKCFIDARTDDPVIRQLCYYTCGEILQRGSFTHATKFRRMLIDWRKERVFLGIMKSLPGVDRDHSYCPAATNPYKKKSKGWHLSDVQHYVVRGCSFVVIALSQSFIRCYSLAFDSWVGRCQDQVVFSVQREIRDCLNILECPVLSLEEIIELCCGDSKKARVNDETLRRLRSSDSLPAQYDPGGRWYHSLTNLKKGFRRKCRVDGVRLAEVDMHATFVAFIASRFAGGDERKLLIKMLQSGKFYHEFASLIGVDPVDAKREFQAEVVFSYKRLDSKLVQGFKRLFPVTWRRLSAYRDGIESCERLRKRGEIIRRCRKSGKKSTTLTRRGQQLVSRYFSWLESGIFVRDSFLQLREMGVWCLPIHDCLLCLPGDAEFVKSMIVKNAFKCLGFEPCVKIEMPTDVTNRERIALSDHEPTGEFPTHVDRSSWDFRCFLKWANEHRRQCCEKDVTPLLTASRRDSHIESPKMGNVYV